MDISGPGRIRSALVACLVAGALARAAEPTSGHGAEVRVDWWSPTSRNTGLDYAFVDDTQMLSGGGELFSLDGSRQGLARLSAAWRPAASGAPRVGARMWEYKGQDAGATGVLPGQVGALLASPDFAIGRSFVDSARAEATLRALAVDATATWERELSSARLAVVAGVRLFRFEQRRVVTYDADLFGEILQEIVNSKSDANGVGPLVGVGFAADLGRRLSLAGRVDLAFPVGDLMALETDTALVDGSFDNATVVDRGGTRQVFPQLGLALHLDLHLPRGFSLRLGYALEGWWDVSRGRHFVDESSQNSTVATSQDAFFEGFLFGAAWEY